MKRLDIFVRNGVEYLRVPRQNWANYLNVVSPYRKYDYNTYNCALKNKNLWCNVCNTSIGSWSNSCTNSITSLNLDVYEDLLSVETDSNDEHYDIEIYRSSNEHTI